MSITKRGHIKKISTLSIVLISGFFTLIIGFMFMTIYWIAEITGVAPVIQLGELSWATSGEGVIIFTILLMLSIFLGSIVVLYLLRRYS